MMSTDLEQHRNELRGDALIDPAAMAVGLQVVVSPYLPVEPSPGEDARRFVRHSFAVAGMFADTLGDVGPLPGDATHAMQVHDKLYVSEDGWARLRGNLTARETGMRPGL